MCTTSNKVTSLVAKLEDNKEGAISWRERGVIESERETLKKKKTNKRRRRGRGEERDETGQREMKSGGGVLGYKLLPYVTPRPLP